jgi:membrane protein implicated in regulation of membrane protease activity
MNWELFYLICFVVGFAFTTLSFLTGTLHLHLHLPGHAHFHVGHAHGSAVKGGHGAFMFLNPMVLAVFLTWFGGTGYLLVHLRHIWVFAGLLISSAAGFVGAGIVLVFVAKVLMTHDYTMDPADYDMTGVLGRVSGSIRQGGTGEMIFEQDGARKACAARSDSNEEVARGEEVVVTRYENGVAYVRRWNELADKAGILPEEEQKESL